MVWCHLIFGQKELHGYSIKWKSRYCKIIKQIILFKKYFRSKYRWIALARNSKKIWNLGSKYFMCTELFENFDIKTTLFLVLIRFLYGLIRLRAQRKKVTMLPSSKTEPLNRSAGLLRCTSVLRSSRADRHRFPDILSSDGNSACKICGIDLYRHSFCCTHIVRMNILL
jgi:hypothetical protein